MIDAVDQRLQDWIGKLARPAVTLLASPGEMQGKQGVSLYLLELITNPPPRGVHRPPLSLSLRYLITTWFEDARMAHRLLGELTFAAMEEKEFEVEATSLPLAAWTVFGTAPRPSLLLRVPLNKPRPEKIAPRVRGRVSVRLGGLGPLQGQLFGPGRIPIMAATIRVPSLGLSTRTDSNGRFVFAGVPRDPPVKEVQVNARGRDVSFPVPTRAEGELLLIELNETQI